jgi:hypothetical protein
MLFMENTGKPRYLDVAYHSAVESVLERIPPSKTWSVKGYDKTKGLAAMSRAAHIGDTKALIQCAIDILYKQIDDLDLDLDLD